MAAPGSPPKSSAADARGSVSLHSVPDHARRGVPLAGTELEIGARPQHAALERIIVQLFGVVVAHEVREVDGAAYGLSCKMPSGPSGHHSRQSSMAANATPLLKQVMAR